MAVQEQKYIPRRLSPDELGLLKAHLSMDGRGEVRIEPSSVPVYALGFYALGRPREAAVAEIVADYEVSRPEAEAAWLVC